MDFHELTRAQAPGAARSDFAPVSPEAQALALPTIEDYDAAHASFLDNALYVLNHSRFTVRTYRWAYQNFRTYVLKFAPAAMSFEDRVRDLDGWVAWNRKRGLAATTTNTNWRSLRPFFKYLAKTRRIPNPFLGAQTPRISRHRLPKALRPEDLQRVLAAAQHYPWRTTLQRVRAVAIISIMVYAGLRKGEVLRLQYGDVDMKEGGINIVAGKGRYGGKDRTVYMPDELRAALVPYLAVRRARGFTCPEFFVTRGNRGLSDVQFRRTLLEIRGAAGVPFFAHALRHSYITMLLRSRVPIHVVQALAGHADIATTALYSAV